MSGTVAVKRLAAVEVSREDSNQHEFNAGRLRRELGLEATRVSGHLKVVYVGETGAEPRTDDTARYTLYDSRATNPARSAEYRMYYDTELIREAAEPGDLLVLGAEDGTTELTAVIARQGSAAESELLDSLFAGEEVDLSKYRFVSPAPTGRDQAHRITEALTPTPELRYDVEGHPLYRAAASAGAMPSTRDMAVSAQELVSEIHGRGLSPDDFMEEAIAAETQLYYAIEEAVHGPDLRRFLDSGPSVREILRRTIRISQAAKSRMGHSLQNHFDTVLEDAEIPRSTPCETENRELPDFVVPSCDSYHDPSYPAEHLRMVACKSTAKERWRQILNEAERIPEKYVLTLDRGLSDAVVRNMGHAGLRAFLPQRRLDQDYGERECRSLLGSVSDLLDELRNAL